MRCIAARLAFATLITCIAMSAIADDIAQTAEAPRDYVSEVLPYPIEEVYARAQLLFDSSRRDYYEDYSPKIYALPEPVQRFQDLSAPARKHFLALPLVRPNKFYVFYGAYPNVQDVLTGLTPYAAMGHSNAALQRYAALPSSDRAQDLYIWSPDAPYWYSEYSLNGHPLPFKAYFIVHLTAADAGHTRVEVIENEPVVRLQGESTVDIHGIVRPYALREVEPTTRDREFLLSCLRQFIERNVPGRHWFSCRENGEVVEKIVPFTVP